MPFLHIAGGFRPATFPPSLQSSIFILSGQIFNKNGQKLRYICPLLSNLGKIGDNKWQKQRYILLLGVVWLPLWLSLWGGGRVHRVQVVQASGLVLFFRGVFRPFVLPFVPLLHCSWWITCKCGSISHFKAVFSGFWGADVYLYGLGALR